VQSDIFPIGSKIGRQWAILQKPGTLFRITFLRGNIAKEHHFYSGAVQKKYRWVIPKFI
jgi:hypothetical protein